MKPANTFALVLVTAPDLKTARSLAKSALQAGLAACANIIPRLESHYWWKGKLDRSAETLLLFKTARAKLGALEKCILANHPYDTPEFLVLNLTKGAARYLAWLRESVSD
jgi:periplasmic divalent cation tolerance protein